MARTKESNPKDKKQQFKVKKIANRASSQNPSKAAQRRDKTSLHGGVDAEERPARTRHQVTLEEARSRMQKLRQDLEDGFIESESELKIELKGILREINAMSRKADGDLKSLCVEVMTDLKNCENAFALDRLAAVAQLSISIERIKENRV